jgi:hypothetical protein
MQPSPKLGFGAYQIELEDLLGATEPGTAPSILLRRPAFDVVEATWASTSLICTSSTVRACHRYLQLPPAPP